MRWFFGHEACGILVPPTGIEPELPGVGGKVSTTGPPGKSLHFTSDVGCAGFFPSYNQAILCDTSRGPMIHSLWYWLQLAQTPQLRAQSQRTVLTSPALLRQSWIPHSHLYFWLTRYKSEGHSNTSLGLPVCLNSPQNSGKHSLTRTALFNMKKDTDEQVDTEAYRARSRRVPSTGPSVPMELGISLSWHMDVFTDAEDLKIPYFGDFWRLSHLVMNSC